jgi:hypothetical protein
MPNKSKQAFAQQGIQIGSGSVAGNLPYGTGSEAERSKQLAFGSLQGTDEQRGQINPRFQG